MDEKNKYIMARIKTQEQIVKVYPEAKNWGKPPSFESMFSSAEEAIMPYLSKTVWVKKKRCDLFRFYYEIKDSGGLVISPDWIDYFDSEDFVPCAKWEDSMSDRTFDIWLDPFIERYIVIDDILIVTG